MENDIVEVPIASIRRDGGTQPREQLNVAVAKEYAEDMMAGAKFPPILLVYDGVDHWLAGGYHRLFAAELLNRETIRAEVRQGTQRDAVLTSLSENMSHGLRRTSADKRRAIVRLLEDPEWSTWSDREIARRLQVDGKTVAGLRPKPTAESRSERIYTTKHGTTAVMDVTRLSTRAPDVAPTPAAAPAQVPVRGSVQLRTFLGEYRAGADLASAATVAEISLSEAKEHAAADVRGEYADIIAIPPPWSVDGDKLTLRVVSPEDSEALAWPPVPIEAGATPPPPLFDFAVAQSREKVMQAIAALAAAPTAEAMANVWADFVGHAVPEGQVARAAAWLSDFAARFPEAEARRQQRVAAMMEKI